MHRTYNIWLIYLKIKFLAVFVTKIDRAFWLFCIIVVVVLYGSLSTALDEGFATWQTFHYGKKEHIAMNGILVIWT